MLGDRAIASGAQIRLGVVAEAIDDRGDMAHVRFSDGSEGEYDLVIGADGVYSQTRALILPDAEKPVFTGQAVWRYNFPRPADLDALQVYNMPTGVGLVPIGEHQMYVYVTTPEPDNSRCEKQGIAAVMRGNLAHCAPAIRVFAERISDDDFVVYRPPEGMLVEGPWHKGTVVLLGDAVHATTPHLGQGAGMAIEDSIVLADELAKQPDIAQALPVYRARRFDRCAYIVRESLAICYGQLGKGTAVDNAKATAEMFAMTSQPI